MAMRIRARRSGSRHKRQLSADPLSRFAKRAHLCRVVTGLRALSASAAACVAVAAGCTGGSDPPRPAPAPTTVTVPAGTGTTVDRAAPVLAGYRAFWDAYLQAADPMDPTNPVLAAHSTGEELQQVRRTFAGHFQRGEVIRGTLDLRPQVTDQTVSTATVTDCYGDSTHVFDSATGVQKDPPESVRYQVTASLVLEGGVWKVSAMKKEGEACTPA